MSRDTVAEDAQETHTERSHKMHEMYTFGYTTKLHLRDFIDPHGDISKDGDPSMVESLTTKWRAYVCAFILAKVGRRTAFVWRELSMHVWKREGVFWGD